MRYAMLFTTLSLFLLVGSSLSQQRDATLSFVQVPDPLSGTNPTYPLIARAPPAVGESFADLRFGTPLTRVTATDGIRGRHEYSRFDPFNVDKSRILLDPAALWNVYSTGSYPYNQPANLIRTVQIEEPRWDPLDPHVLWGLQEFSILKVNVSTGQTTVFKDFSLDRVLGPIVAHDSVYRITTRDEGESSADKRYWVFFLQGDERANYEQRYIFTWDAVPDSILGVYRIAPNELSVDYVGMSVLGNWVVIGGDPWNGGNLVGQVRANRELTRFTSLGSIGHSDVGLTSDGKEVLVGQNADTDYIDMIALDPAVQTRHIVRLFYESGSPQGLQSGVHISCNVPGYCVISTYIAPGLPEQNWLDRSIIIVRLDPQNPRAYYLAKVHNTTQEYWEETHATVANDGARIVWASNWGANVGQEQVFLMQLDMPPDWKNLLSAIDVDRPERPDTYSLTQNYPNPFNATTMIEFSLPRYNPVTLRIYNLLGEEVATLLEGDHAPGVVRVPWDASFAPSGEYFYRLRSGQYIQTRKAILLR